MAAGGVMKLIWQNPTTSCPQYLAMTIDGQCFSPVMPALVAGIHVFLAATLVKSWMAGTGPAMTAERLENSTP
jgi:hypothetical protein